MREYPIQCVCIGFVWQSLVVGGDRGGFCEKFLEASKEATARDLWDNRAKNGGRIVQQPATAERSENVRETAVHTQGQ